MSAIELCRSAQLESVTAIEQILAKTLNDINSSKSSIINLEEIITGRKSENRKSKKKIKGITFYQIYIQKIIIFVIFTTISTSVILFLPRLGMLVIPISTAGASGLTIAY